MEIIIGMTRDGLRRFANEIITKCDQADQQEHRCISTVTRYIQANGSGPELTLSMDDDDMHNPDTAPDASYYDMER